MEANIDMDDPTQLATLEERLYSCLHHSFEAPANSEETSSPITATGPTRVVSKNSVVNNVQSANLVSKMKRYWATTGEISRDPNTYQQKNMNSYQKHSEPSQTNQPDRLGSEKGKTEPKKMFLTPYQSLLGNIPQNGNENRESLPVDATTVVSEKNNSKNGSGIHKIRPQKKQQKMLAKKRQQSSQLSVEKKLAGLMKLVDKDSNRNRKQHLEFKKAKAFVVRKCISQRIVAHINIDSSDEEFQTKASLDKIRGAWGPDEEIDDVVIIPTPEPQKICIDCSDDELAQDSFAFPHAKKSMKKAVVTKFNSPRCLSPSNSSIMSDDFIGHHDRSRLNESFTGSIPNDDELDCSIEGQHRTCSKNGKMDVVRQRGDRAPSISSEETVCTSSDTTDQEKLRQEANKGSISKTLSPSRREIDTSAKGKKEEHSSKKGSKQEKASVDELAEQSLMPLPNSGSNKSDSTKKSTPSLLSNDTVGKKKMVGLKSRTKCMSPIRVAMELASKHFEASNTLGPTIRSTKKSKKDQTSDPVQSNRLKPTSPLPIIPAKTNAKKSVTTRSSSGSDIDSLYQMIAESKSKKKTGRLRLYEDSVSSESDYDLSLVATSKESFQNQEKPSSNAVVRANTLSEQHPDKKLSVLQHMDNVSSESDYEELLTLSHKSSPNVTKEARKRSGRKRKQYNSENYSDEDFACMLTEIVQAVSDTDVEEDEKEEEEQQEVNSAMDKPDDIVTSTPTADHDSEKRKKPLKADATSAKKKKRDKDSSFAVADMNNEGKSGEEVVQIAERLSPTIQTGVIVDNNDALSKSNRVESQIRMALPDCAWNEEMKMFYNNVWMDDNFTLSSVLKKMPRGRKHWQIVQKDLYPDRPKKEVICNNCGELGHMRYKCRNAPKPRVCYMCGEQGHQEPRCPKTICLNCGAKTRSFVRGCDACARDLNVTCHLCGVRGHAQRNCPDMWRRYHSTTEDNVPLKQQYQTNMKAKNCCICCKPGHQAHVCTAAYRIFGQAVPTIHIKSYQPAYRGYQEPHKSTSEQESPARYNLFSEDANECELNLHELVENADGFYYRFAKSAGLLGKHQQRLQEEKEATEQSLEQQLQEEHVVEYIEEEVRPTPSEMQQKDVQSASKQSTATVSPMKKKLRSDSPDRALESEEDSNYNFSELLTDQGQENAHCTKDAVDPEERTVANDIESLPEFIPFTSYTRASLKPLSPSELTKEKSSVVKVFLTKPHAKLLLSSAGGEFLNFTAEKHKVKLSISFEPVGNVLIVNGETDAQDRVHQDLVRYLNRNEPNEANEKLLCANNVPWTAGKALRYITNYLLQLQEPYRDVEKLFYSYRQAQEKKYSVRTYEKLRRTLNINLFGLYGLRDGRKHLNVLRQNVVTLRKSASPSDTIKPQLRSEIHQSLLYIFTTYDHIDYSQIVSEYVELRRTRKLSKITFSDLDLPLLPNARTSVEPARTSCNSSLDSNQNGWPTMGRERRPSRRDDLMLNTSDQLIDSDRLEYLERATCDIHDERKTRRLRLAREKERSRQQRNCSRNVERRGRMRRSQIIAKCYTAW